MLNLEIRTVALSIALLLSIEVVINTVSAQPAAFAPASQSQGLVDNKSMGCLSCHSRTDRATMHSSPAVKLGCIDCHGGDASILNTAAISDQTSPQYRDLLRQAHVMPRFPEAWDFPSSANPRRSYTLLNRESPEFIRFMNPSDYRVAREACGACHLDIIQASVRSLHSTGAMLWGGAAYNNGILPYKNYLLGESYNREGVGVLLKAAQEPTPDMKAQGILSALYPLPAWETVAPGDNFRAFEDGGRNKSSRYPETANPNLRPKFETLEEPGRPDIKQSNRGPGTGGRVAIPVLNITKTRLNDPFTWFMGTNDQPGDYRNSGCASCHVIYANDRDPRHSGIYSQYGHEGKSISADPTISKQQQGHPLRHAFTRAIPTSQCMICHMHQPNMFLNSFLGYTMWDYESDAPFMWPSQQAYPDSDTIRAVLDRNPEGASPRGNWADPEFLRAVSTLNPKLNDTQFADYHGHGWNFRAVFKRDRKGNLLDAQNKIVATDDVDKFEKAVHLSSVHVDVGMHCVDCHYSQDNHGNGHLYGEVALAVEIACRDCHGTVEFYPNLSSSGPAAPGRGTDFSLLRNPDGKKRFEWIGGKLMQRSVLDPDLEWQLSLVKDTVNPQHEDYNRKAARAKLMQRDTENLSWGLPTDGSRLDSGSLAHSDEQMECYTCHTSWTTTCAGCHLPSESNWKTPRLHYEGGETRNFATYNPQVARDQAFLLGKRGPAKGGKYAPIRSSSALVLSSTNSNRERIYMQQPPIAASGFSSQAFNPHFPHTTRKTETRTCDDCHLSEKDDNNAIMAQLLALGTNFLNFVGRYVWLGTQGNITAVQVTEWQEPQAVRGSYLQKYVYPDWYARHQENNRQLETGHSHRSGSAACIQMRGEYVYVAEGRKGTRVYDIASIDNKGVSQAIISAPFSPLGQDTRIKSKNATCVVLPTTQPIHPDRNRGDLMRVDNQEQAFHPLYNYAYISDAEEGLILTDVNTLADSEPRNNFLDRALTWNPEGVLDGARHITLGGYYLYITVDTGLVIVNIDEPLQPKVVARVALNRPRASALQFRYLFVSDADGLKVIDVTRPEKPVLVPDNTLLLAQANRIYLARTYAYVAAGSEGIAIVNIENPRQMRLLQKFNADGKLQDSRDIIVASTNASLFAYVADGIGGLKILQLTSPESQAMFYGFSPEPRPELIAVYPTEFPALSISKGLDRDRGVDETGGQIAVFGRKGSRPLNAQEMKKLYLDKRGEPWYVEVD